MQYEGSIKYYQAREDNDNNNNNNNNNNKNNKGQKKNHNNTNSVIKIKKATIQKRIKSFFVIHPSQRPDILSMVLCGFFFVNTVTAELISGKLFVVGPFTVSIGSIMWPFVFLTTDVTNEYFGKRMVRRLSYLMALFLGYIYALLSITIRIPASEFSPVQQSDYSNVFGQSNWIIVGSLVAFLVGQLVDISVYHFVRTWTKGKHLWLRSTGSTVVSQLVDTFVVSGIAFWLPGKISAKEFVNLAGVAYIYKLAVAILMTPVIYGLHHLMDKFLGEDKAAELVARAASSADEMKDKEREKEEEEEEDNINNNFNNFNNDEESVNESERMSSQSEEMAMI